jgi:type VI secretion system FHA domain protein
MSFFIELSGPDYSRTETVSPGLPPLVVGRDPSASVCVPDPEKSISRKHIALDYSETGVRIVVLSQVNGISTVRGEIVCGQQVILRTGESAQLGPYTIFVRGPSAGSDFQPSAQMLQDVDPFTAIGSPLTPHSSVFDNAFFKPVTSVATPAPANHDLLDAFSPAAAPRGFSAGPSIRSSEAVPSAKAGLGNTLASDPLAAFGNIAQPHIEASSRSIDDFLGAAGPGVGPSSGLGASNMLAPKYVQGSQRLAVDHVHDFNLPIRTASAQPMPARFDPPPSPFVSPKAFVQPSLPSEAHEPQAKSWAEFSSDWMTPKLASERDETFDPSDPFSDLASSATRDSFSYELSAAPGRQETPEVTGARATVNVRTTTVESDAVPLPDHEPKLSEVPKTLDATALAAMCRGLGVDSPTGLDAHQWEQMGASIRVIVHGLTELMNTRAEIKKELRAADRTMLGSQDNNPLKSGLAQEEILQYILFNPTGIGGYMKVDRALSEAINDLRAHEFASIAAVRAAVEGTVRDFDPKKLRTTLTKGKTKLPQFLDNARLWDIYAEYYENKASHMADWLEQLFNHYFMPVYSRESERLRCKPKANPNPPERLRPD